MDGGYRRRFPTRTSDESGSLVPARTPIPIGRSLLPLNAEDAHDNESKSRHTWGHIEDGGPTHRNWWDPPTPNISPPKLRSTRRLATDTCLPCQQRWPWIYSHKRRPRGKDHSWPDSCPIEEHEGRQVRTRVAHLATSLV